jgi:hypothetical protein
MHLLGSCHETLREEKSTDPIRVLFVIGNPFVEEDQSLNEIIHPG